MDDPEYIVLVALDTPSRATGIYISGGVMAAPTVGAVMSDILPYLGVERSFAEGEPQGMAIVMEDLTGMTASEAEKFLVDQKLTARLVGDGETVTGQIPAAGQIVPGGSQVLLYFGESVSQETVEVPDFRGMNRSQAAQEAGKLGLYILPTGNPETLPSVTVTMQSVSPGTKVTVGSMITLEFTDTKARD
jgi:stage V sporulation protein D (sporulation-specific penicillin-binding protein)